MKRKMCGNVTKIDSLYFLFKPFWFRIENILNRKMNLFDSTKIDQFSTFQAENI